MKLLLSLIFWACLFVVPGLARTLTSADGQRTIEAELIDYRPSTDSVVFRYKGKSARQTAKASAFSAEDQEYFAEFLKEKTKRDALNVVAEEETERSEDEGGIYTYDRLSSFFRVSVRNRGEFGFEDLSAKYDIFVMRYDAEGKSKTEVVSGEASLGEILPRLDETFETESVRITLDCETSSSCPTCERHAASVKRERVIGLRVRIFNAEGEQLTEFHSSNAVRKLGEEEDAKRSG
jgi:hypothetical protein